MIVFVLHDDVRLLLLIITIRDLDFSINLESSMIHLQHDCVSIHAALYKAYTAYRV